MSRRVLIEVTIEAEIEDEERVVDQALDHFRGMERDDPDGELMARLEQQIRENPDEAGLQNLVRPKGVLYGVHGVRMIGAHVLVRQRRASEQLGWDGD